MAEGRVRFIEHKGKEVLFLDFSNAKPNEVIEIVGEAKKVILAQPFNSLLTLTDVTNTRFDTDVIEAMKEFVAGNRPYVKAATIVGLSGLHKVIYNVVMKFSGRNIPTFNDAEEAKDWLASR